MIQVEGTFGGGSKLNGVKGNYLATADVAKGDFVQLTTKGVEEVAFMSAGTINAGEDMRIVSAAVLSETQFIVAYDGSGKESDTQVSRIIYAQVYTYTNGTWAAGTPLLIETIDDKTYAVIRVCRLTSSRAAIIFLASTMSVSRIYILDINENIDVVASLSEVRYFSKSTSSARVRLIPLTEDTFVMLAPSGDATAAIYSWVITYTNGTITANRIGFSGSTSASRSSYAYSCKLNDHMVLIAVDNEDYCNILTVANGTGTLTETSLKIGSPTLANPALLYSGELVQLSENRVLAVTHTNKVSSFDTVDTVSYIAEYVIITYDPETSTLSKEGAVGEFGAKGAYYSLDANKLSDTEVVVLAADKSAPASASGPLYFVIVDTVTGTYSGKMLTPISAVGKKENEPITCAGFGWMIAFSGTKSILVAPLVSQTTAAPYVTRLDGVATKGATAGQMAEVITP